MTSLAEQTQKLLNRRRVGSLCVCSAVVVAAWLPVASAQSAGFDLQAHAGGRGETTGESLRAFRKAIEMGVTTIELDIGITKDGQPVVWHDSVIKADRCEDTGAAFAGDPAYPYVGKLVHDLTWAQIRTLVCAKPDPEFPQAEVVQGNKIVALSELFAVTGSSGVRYNIETKVDADRPATTVGPQEFVDVVLAVIRAADIMDRVEIQSFDWRTLPLVRRAEPSIPLVALWNDETWVPDSPWTAGIDPAVIGDPIVGASMVGADILSPDYRLVDASFVARAHALGLKVIPWTVDDVEAMRQQVGAGVDGLITNYPTLLRAVLVDLGIPTDVR